MAKEEEFFNEILEKIKDQPPFYTIPIDKEKEIYRLRLLLINQVSKTRSLQERLEIIEEAIQSCLKKELSELACIYAIKALITPVKITEKDVEIVQKIVDKSQ